MREPENSRRSGVFSRNFPKLEIAFTIFSGAIGWRKSKGIISISENPYSLLLPIEKIKYKKLDFGSLTNKLLFGKV